MGTVKGDVVKTDCLEYESGECESNESIDSARGVRTWIMKVGVDDSLGPNRTTLMIDWDPDGSLWMHFFNSHDGGEPYLLTDEHFTKDQYRRLVQKLTAHLPRD